MDQPLYNLERIEDEWINFNSLDENKKKELSDLFHPDHFFLDFSPNDFYEGIDMHGRKHLLIPQNILKSIRKHLEEEKMIMLPELSIPPSFMNLKSVPLDNETSYNHVVNKIVKYNSNRSTIIKESEDKASNESREKEQEKMPNEGEVVDFLEEKKRSKEANKQRKARKHQDRIKDLENILNSASEMINDCCLPDMEARPDLYFMAVDIESFEEDSRCILEIGWSIFDAKRHRFFDRHIIIKEYLHIRNTKYCIGDKDGFLFGTSETLSLVDAKKAIQTEFNLLHGKLILVCHAIENELKYFKKMGVNANPLHEFDTCKLNMAIQSDLNNIKLSNLLTKLNVDFFSLHNAGNDAHYTLMAFLKLCNFIPMS